MENLDGIVVPGGFGKRGTEGKIKAIQYSRLNKIPYLGLCLGLQLAVVEFARNVCGLGKANSTEMDPGTPHPVIWIMPEQRVNLEEENFGASMRLGSYPCILKPDTKVFEAFEKKEKISDRHRHRYEVNPDYIEILEKNGLIISGISPNRRLVEIIELPDHPWFVATQAHPEFTSRPGKPHPLFDAFIKSCLDKK